MSPGRPRSSRSGEWTTPFRSFWIAAFDGTDHFASADDPTYRHRIEADYARAREAGVECVYESVGWRRAERDGRFDFSSTLMRAECARRAGLQVAWTICDARWPEDVDVAAGDFATRVGRFAAAAALALAPYADDAPIYSPVDEIGFLSFALAETSLFGRALRNIGRGSEGIRRALVRASLAACDAILEVDPRARFVHREAAMPSVGPARAAHDGQYAAWDMLAGRLAPELGGHARYLDIVAVHCHRTSQWRVPSQDDAAPESAPPRDGAFPQLLDEAYARYRRPLVVFETSRIASGRAQWLRQFGDAIAGALERGIPVVGAGLCRVVERPAWEDPRRWRERRLWDALLAGGAAPPHTSDSAYRQALREVTARIDSLVDHPHPGYLS